ncbi:ejaculatory bulb-specific protein 3-like [Aricia agestis]|uniref:ejaculatory bulb-specific protein 3-like n=1 Tax=Aricia agestis TaxID=91739 RepID=UPI001C20A843|nr:ejaculatory bulb-specific protein 3-like [Aricia agestis]
MKAITVCVFAVLALAAAAPETYTDKFDNINLDEVMGNDRLLQSYFKCLIDEGPCTAEGNELKSHMGEAVKNECAKCTDAQKNGTRKMIKFLVKEKPDMWNALRAKYDPENIYYNKHKAELESL